MSAKGLVLDNALKSYEERLAHIESEINRLGEANITNYMKKKIASYLIEATDLEPRGEIITPNRMVTVNKRETSREGLVDKLEGGESALHSLIRQDKNTILTPKVEITEEDIATIPTMAQLRAEIDKLEAYLKDNPDLDAKKRGKTRQTIIELRKDQYVLKNAYKQPIFGRGNGNNLDEEAKYDISLQDVDQVKDLLVNYAGLKIAFHDKLDSDMKWILEDLDNLIKQSLADKPTLLYILNEKINGSNNQEIREGLIKIFGVDHTQEYISSLYRNKIPQTIANQATENWIDNIYMNKLKGNYKRCSRCKEIKLANNRNFSINKTSSSQFYSICKSCRNQKNK